MKIRAVLKDVYVPRFNGNRDLDEKDQVTVEIIWPTAAQRESLKGYRINPADQDVKVVFDTERILETHIGKITNLEPELNGKPAPVKNGKDLAETKVTALVPLIDELKGYITSEDGLEEEQVKN